MSRWHFAPVTVPETPERLRRARSLFGESALPQPEAMTPEFESALREAVPTPQAIAHQERALLLQERRRGSLVFSR